MIKTELNICKELNLIVEKISKNQIQVKPKIKKKDRSCCQNIGFMKTGNTNLEGRLNKIDLLNKVSCFVKK